MKGERLVQFLNNMNTHFFGVISDHCDIDDALNEASLFLVNFAKLNLGTAQDEQMAIEPEELPTSKFSAHKK